MHTRASPGLSGLSGHQEISRSGSIPGNTSVEHLVRDWEPATISDGPGPAGGVAIKATPGAVNDAQKIVIPSPSSPL